MHADEEPGGEETVGALPQETDRRKPSCFTPTEGKEGGGEVRGEENQREVILLIKLLLSIL